MRAVAREVQVPGNPLELGLRLGEGLAILESAGPVTPGLSEWSVVADRPTCEVRVAAGKIVQRRQGDWSLVDGPVAATLGKINIDIGRSFFHLKVSQSPWLGIKSTHSRLTNNKKVQAS